MKKTARWITLQSRRTFIPIIWRLQRETGRSLLQVVRTPEVPAPRVPDELGGLGTTRFAIEEALRMHAATPLSDHLEIETYTWDVLPDSMKTGSIVDYVERELDWVKGQLV